MDHLLDFVFMWYVPVSYVFVVSPDKQWMVFTIAFLYGTLMVNSFLEFSITNSLKITYLGMGPTEIRLAFIVVNTVLIFKGPGFLGAAFLWIIGVLGVGLTIVIYGSGKLIWKIDMARKDSNQLAAFWVRKTPKKVAIFRLSLKICVIITVDKILNERDSGLGRIN